MTVPAPRGTAAIAAVPPLDPALFARRDPLALAGSRCAVCGCTMFPVAPSCARCGAVEPGQVTLPDAGTVWSWTRQHVPPKPPYAVPPGAFAPFALGYVDLGDVLVEGLLVPAAHPWRIGEPVRLTLATLPTGDGDRLTYAFTPSSSHPSSGHVPGGHPGEEGA